MIKKLTLTVALSTCLLCSTYISTTLAQTPTGKVLETMNAAGYTYMLVENGSRNEWVAIPESSVEVGQEVSYTSGMIMENFHSKTLDKTFPTIMFSSGIVASAPATATQTAGEQADNSFAAAIAKERGAPAAPAAAPMAESSAGSMGAIVPMAEVSVDKAAGDNGYTVDQVFTQAKELNGQTIRVRGKVVKVSEQIMGRNWLHMQDGTGNPMKNSHDLVVTTSELVSAGSIVTIEGVVAADKDFGAGYSYEAIVEQAKIISE